MDNRCCYHSLLRPHRFHITCLCLIIVAFILYTIDDNPSPLSNPKAAVRQQQQQQLQHNSSSSSAIGKGHIPAQMEAEDLGHDSPSSLIIGTTSSPITLSSSLSSGRTGGVRTHYHLPPHHPSCPCYSQDEVHCCMGQLLQIHKHGFFITRQLFRPYHILGRHKEVRESPTIDEVRTMIPFQKRRKKNQKKKKKNQQTKSSKGHNKKANNNSNNNKTKEKKKQAPSFKLRHALVIRDMKEALVSGYLYHKSGHECWLNGHGNRPLEVGSNYLTKTRHNDESIMLYVSNRTLSSIPPLGTNRTICHYLAEESEYHRGTGNRDEEGIKLYVGVCAVCRSLCTLEV